MSTGWEATLAKYPATDLILVEVASGLAARLESAGAWSCVYRDDTFRLYARPGLELDRVDRTGQEIVGHFP